jgi:hypothetical protein
VMMTTGDGTETPDVTNMKQTDVVMSQSSMKNSCKVLQIIVCESLHILRSEEFNIFSKIAVFWVVAPCSLVEVYQRFRGPCCLHHQGDESSP